MLTELDSICQYNFPPNDSDKYQHAQSIHIIYDMNTGSSALSQLADTASVLQEMTYTDEMRQSDEYIQSFICPILQDFPENPCRFNGHVYEYSCIDQWIKKFRDEGKDYIQDPITREKIYTFSRPNPFTQVEKSNLDSNIVSYKSRECLRENARESSVQAQISPINQRAPVPRAQITLPDTYWQRVESTSEMNSNSLHSLRTGFWVPSDEDSSDDDDLLNITPFNQNSSINSDGNNVLNDSIANPDNRRLGINSSSQIRSNFLTSFVQTEQQRNVLVFILEKARENWSISLVHGKRLVWFRDILINELYNQVSGPLAGYVRVSHRNICDKFRRAETLAKTDYESQGQHSNNQDGSEGEDLPRWKKLFFEYFDFLKSNPSNNNRTNNSRNMHRRNVIDLIGHQPPLGSEDTSPRSEIRSENAPEIDPRTVGLDDTEDLRPRQRRRTNDYQRSAMTTLQSFSEMSNVMNNLNHAFDGLNDSIFYGNRSSRDMIETLEKYEGKLASARENNDQEQITRYERYIRILNSELDMLNNHFSSRTI